MSAVLSLPVCLCVSAAASRGQAPHRNASLSAPPKSRQPARGPSENRRGTAADMRRQTAGDTWHGPQRRSAADGGTTRHPWDCLDPPEAPTMGVNPAAEGPAVSRDHPRKANVAREGPPQNPATHGRTAHPADNCPSGAPGSSALPYPTSPAGARECGPALAALQPVLYSTATNPLAPLSPFHPRIPDGGRAPHPHKIQQRQRTGGGPRH